MNITALKEVLKRVRELFKTDKSSISAVFFDKPRILIWFLVSYFVMVSSLLLLTLIQYNFHRMNHNTVLCRYNFCLFIQT